LFDSAFDDVEFTFDASCAKACAQLFPSLLVAVFIVESVIGSALNGALEVVWVSYTMNPWIEARWEMRFR